MPISDSLPRPDARLQAGIPEKRPKSSVDHSWIKPPEEQRPWSAPKERDAYKEIAREINRKVAESVESKLVNAKVQADLIRMGELKVFQQGNRYFICRDQSVAKEHFEQNGSEDLITEVAFSKLPDKENLNIVIKGIDPSDYTAFQDGDQKIHITHSGGKLTDEHPDWKLISQEELRGCFAEFTNGTETNKDTIFVDLRDPSWKDHRKAIKDGDLYEALYEFLLSRKKIGMLQLLEQVDALEEKFFNTLSNLEKDDEHVKMYEEGDEEYKHCLKMLSENFKTGIWIEKKIEEFFGILNDSLIKKRKALLEINFDIFEKTEEGKGVRELRGKYDELFGKGSPEAQKAITERTASYRAEFEDLKEEFLIDYFTKEESTVNPESREEWKADRKKLVALMQDNLERCVKIGEWEVKLDSSYIDDNLDKLSSNSENDETKTNEQNEQFNRFINSSEGIRIRRILSEIRFLDTDDIQEDNKSHRETSKEEFDVQKRIFLKNYHEQGNIYHESKENAIKSLEANLVSSREKLYNKQYDYLIGKSSEREKVEKLQGEFKAHLDNPIFAKRRELRQQLSLFTEVWCSLRDELVRAYLMSGTSEGEMQKQYIADIKKTLEKRNEFAKNEIDKAEIIGFAEKYKNISSDNVKEDLKEESEEYLQDIQDFHVNIPDELYNDRDFRVKYIEKVGKMLRSVEAFKTEDNEFEKGKNIDEIHSNLQDIREFLSENMLEVFAVKYQGAEYIGFKDKYRRASKLGIALSPAWKELESIINNNVGKFHEEETKLLKSKDEQEIKKCFSNLMKIVEECCELAIIKAGKKDDMELNPLSNGGPSTVSVEA